MSLFDDLLVGALLHAAPPTKQILSGLVQTNLTGPDEWGCFPFDPSKYYAGNQVHVRSIVLCAVLNVSVGGQTCTLELFDKTLGQTVVTITSTSLSPAIVRSGVIPISTTGAANTIASTEHLYGVRLSRTGGSSSNYVVCKYAALELNFT